MVLRYTFSFQHFSFQIWSDDPHQQSPTFFRGVWNYHLGVCFCATDAVPHSLTSNFLPCSPLRCRDASSPTLLTSLHRGWQHSSTHPFRPRTRSAKKWAACFSSATGRLRKLRSASSAPTVLWLTHSWTVHGFSVACWCPSHPCVRECDCWRPSPNCLYIAHRRDTLARLEAHRDREGMGLAPWGVSPEEEREILRREVERNQPPWLEEWICSCHQSTMKHYYCVCLFGGKTMNRLKPEVEFTYVFEFLVHAGKLVGRTPKILGMAQDDSKTEIIEDLWISFKLKTMIKS